MEIPKYLISFRKTLTLRNYSKNTIENYACQVELFLRTMDGRFTEFKKIYFQSTENEIEFEKFLIKKIQPSLNINHKK